MYSFAFGGDIVEYCLRYRRLLNSRDDIRKHSGLSANDIQVLRRSVRLSIKGAPHAHEIEITGPGLLA